jgi:hypothetical protein
MYLILFRSAFHLERDEMKYQVRTASSSLRFPSWSPTWWSISVYFHFVDWRHNGLVSKETHFGMSCMCNPKRCAQSFMQNLFITEPSKVFLLSVSFSLHSLLHFRLFALTDFSLKLWNDKLSCPALQPCLLDNLIFLQVRQRLDYEKLNIQHCRNEDLHAFRTWTFECS